MTGERPAICGGHGGLIYEYLGPQFGSQWVEESCDKCDGWHEDQRAWTSVALLNNRQHGPRIGWLRRRRLQNACVAHLNCA